MNKPLTCCFLGGWGTTADLWQATLAEARMQFPELSGFAEPHFFGWLECVREWPLALAALASLPAPAVLVGWSLGSLLALRAAIEFPEKIAAMVLVSATPHMCSAEGYHGADPRMLSAMCKRFPRNSDAVLGDFASRCAAPDGGVAARESYLQQASYFSTDELAGGLEALATLDLRSRLAEIRIPSALLHGALDQIVPVASARFLAAQLSLGQTASGQTAFERTGSERLDSTSCFGRLRLLEGCGHALPFTHPERIAQLIGELILEARCL